MDGNNGHSLGDIITYHAAGVSRRQLKIKNVEIVEFHDHIWNRHEKRSQISTNTPGIGSLIREIAIKISEM